MMIYFSTILNSNETIGNIPWFNISIEILIYTDVNSYPNYSQRALRSNS